MKCNKCGAELSLKDKFCLACGELVEQTSEGNEAILTSAPDVENNINESVAENPTPVNNEPVSTSEIIANPSLNTEVPVSEPVVTSEALGETIAPSFGDAPVFETPLVTANLEAVNDQVVESPVMETIANVQNEIPAAPSIEADTSITPNVSTEIPAEPILDSPVNPEIIPTEPVMETTPAMETVVNEPLVQSDPVVQEPNINNETLINSNPENIFGVETNNEPANPSSLSLGNMGDAMVTPAPLAEPIANNTPVAPEIPIDAPAVSVTPTPENTMIGEEVITTADTSVMLPPKKGMKPLLLIMLLLVLVLGAVAAYMFFFKDNGNNNNDNVSSSSSDLGSSDEQSSDLNAPSGNKLGNLEFIIPDGYTSTTSNDILTIISSDSSTTIAYTDILSNDEEVGAIDTKLQDLEYTALKLGTQVTLFSKPYYVIEVEKDSQKSILAYIKTPEEKYLEIKISKNDNTISYPELTIIAKIVSASF